jgi:hypothetical protein
MLTKLQTVDESPADPADRSDVGSVIPPGGSASNRSSLDRLRLLAGGVLLALIATGSICGAVAWRAVSVAEAVFATLVEPEQTTLRQRLDGIQQE